MNAVSVRALLVSISAVILLVACAWSVHSYNEGLREQGRVEVRAQYAERQAAANELARQKEEFWRQKTEEARRNANEREVTIRSLATAAGASSNRLRDHLASLSQGASSATADANRNSTTALAAVLNECQARYRDLAEKADRHVNDVRTFEQAWPK